MNNVTEAYKYARRKFNELNKKFRFVHISVSYNKYNDTIYVQITSVNKYTEKEKEEFHDEFQKVRNSIIDKYPKIYLEYKITQ